MKVLVLVTLSALFSLCLITAQAIKRLPLKELQQRARAGSFADSAIYRLAKYGYFSSFLLWLIGSLSLADLLFITSRNIWWLGALIVLTASAMVVYWRPVRGPRGWAWSLAGLMAGLIAYILSFIEPGTEKFNHWLARFNKPQPSGRIYEKEDLLALLKDQINQPDNRIDEPDLKRAIHGLTFKDKTVGQLMLPSREVKWLPANELIGPTIMDELHKTGQTRFPVVRSASKTAKPQILGTLYIGNLLNHLDQKGKVRDLMNPGAYFINEASSLEQALDAYLKTGSQLLIAVDGRGETVGVLSVDDVLEQAFGQKINDDFNDYDNPRLAADHEPFETLP